MLRKTWFGGVFKPKNLHSLEHLKYLYSVLSKNQTVSESNRGLLVETLRSIAEILIWGDQNDSSVFDFFLEKNMLSFFLRIMKQKCGSYVCVQLLQTLNILFENIRNETSLYYLLSNNHVNSIIVHKFDFSDEEVMAYYISFLKTLSFKLNSHTIHFFYNDHTNDFPLYTEAIKFFNHPESMVRIAVRTLTLNVYRVNDQSMLQFIRDRTAAPYFSNLVWFIGNHILELDSCLKDDIDHDSRDRLSGLVAEYLDNLHYLNDILRLHITPLNHLLAHHLLHRLLLPLLLHSLLPPSVLQDTAAEVGGFEAAALTESDDSHYQSSPHSSSNELSDDGRQRRRRGKRKSIPRVSRVVSLFLLAQVFLILSFPPLVATLARTLVHAGASLLQHYNNDKKSCKNKTGFIAPEESLEKSLLSYGASSSLHSTRAADSSSDSAGNEEVRPVDESQSEEAIGAFGETREVFDSSLEETELNITDEEKQQLLAYQLPSCCVVTTTDSGSSPLSSRPFLESVLDALYCKDNDYAALFALCLLYALGHSSGKILIDCFKEDKTSGSSSCNAVVVQAEPTIDGSSNESSSAGDNRARAAPILPSSHPGDYNTLLVERLLHVITLSTQFNSKVRVVTLEMAIQVLKQVVEVNSAPASVASLDSSSCTNTASSQAADTASKDPDQPNDAATQLPSTVSCPTCVNASTPCSKCIEVASSSALTHDKTAADSQTVSSNCANDPDSEGDPQSAPLPPPPAVDCSDQPEAAVNCTDGLPSDINAGLDSTDNQSDAVSMPKSNVEGTQGSEPVVKEDPPEVTGEGPSIIAAGPAKGDECSKRTRPISGNRACLSDEHLALLEGAREEATLVLRNFYKSEEMFLDLFEDEWSHSGCGQSKSSQSETLKVEYLLQDSSMLLPPTATPLTGIHLNKRRPCGEVERARRAMRVFFLVRGVCLDMRREQDHQLPLTKPSSCVKVEDILDLNNSDLIACVVIPRDGERCRRFLVIDVLQLILVEPDQRRLGWGVAKFVGFLQDLEVTGDKDDSRVLHITLHRPAATASMNRSSRSAPAPLLAAKFIFDDHIRCMAAKQRLCKGRNKARQRKLHQIARLLELPSHLQPCPSPPTHALSAMRQEAHHLHRRINSATRDGRSNRVSGSSSGSSSRHNRSGPGRASSAYGGAMDGGASQQQHHQSRRSGSGHRHSSQSRHLVASVEEIQLEDITSTPPDTGSHHSMLKRL